MDNFNDETMEDEDQFVSSFLSDDYRDKVDFTGGQRRSFLDHSLDSIFSFGSSFLPSIEADREEKFSPPQHSSFLAFEQQQQFQLQQQLQYHQQSLSRPTKYIKTEYSPMAEPTNFEEATFLPNPYTSPIYERLNYGPTVIKIEPKSGNDMDIVIHEQPALEVRTRTPSENRTFSVGITVIGEWQANHVIAVRASLVYATEPLDPPPAQNILGGQKVVRINTDSRAMFENLCMSEASTKHKEREFRIDFTLIRSDQKPVGLSRQTRPFYAYSHKRVLSRRKNIKLRTINKQYGSFQGGEEMHVIGAPFISGPSLRCVFRTPHGDVSATSLELYSESVLFFRLPAYPCPSLLQSLTPDTEVKVTMVVTNDGKSFSNPLEFTYVTGNRR